MIKVNGGMVEFEGTEILLLGEITCLLHDFYYKLVERDGKEYADKTFAKMGRLAVLSEEELDNMTSETAEKARKILGDEAYAEVEAKIEELIHKGDN